MRILIVCAAACGLYALPHTAEPPAPTEPAGLVKVPHDAAWCRSISHYDGQFQFCMEGVRSGAFTPYEYR